MLDELAILRNQHLLDQVGMVEEENRPGPESRPDQVAVLAMPARECPQAVAAEFPQVSEEPVLPGAGRTLYLRSRACLRTHADILETLALKRPCGRCGIDDRNSSEYNGPLSGPPGNTGQVVSSPPRARRAPGGVHRGILRGQAEDRLAGRDSRLIPAAAGPGFPRRMGRRPGRPGRRGPGSWPRAGLAWRNPNCRKAGSAFPGPEGRSP